jgi:hypothetical protein
MHIDRKPAFHATQQFLTLKRPLDHQIDFPLFCFPAKNSGLYQYRPYRITLRRTYKPQHRPFHDSSLLTYTEI